MQMFTFRLSCSGKAVHRAFGTQGQEAFLEGHQQAFEVFAGTPVFHVRLRQPQERGVAGAVWADSHRVGPLGHVPLALRLPMPFYCNPGVPAKTSKAC